MTVSDLAKDSRAAGEVLPPVTLSAQQEVDHRMANSLQLVAAMLSMQRREIVDPAAREGLQTAIDRIGAIGAVHRQLYRSDDAQLVDIAEYLLELARGLELSYGTAEVPHGVHVDVEQALVSAEFASLIGIMTTELVINACKHAYRSDQPGDVDVSMAFRSDGFEMEVRDYGRGSTGESFDASEGLGSHIIKVVTRRLGGTMERHSEAGGTRFVLKGALPALRKARTGRGGALSASTQ
jgi:two-component sensor histidine kinase